MLANQLTRDYKGNMDGDIEFWSMQRVMEAVGLSRSEIYRRIRGGSFPASRSYRGSSRVFWVSDEVRHWQRQELAAAVDGLIG